MHLQENTETLHEQNAKLPGFYQALILIAIAGLISIIIGPVIIMGGKTLPWLNEWAIFISYTLSFWVVLIIAQKWWKVPHFEAKSVNLIVYLLLIPLILALSIVTEGLVSLIPMPEKIQKMFEQMVQLNFQGYLTIGIAAPLLEELIFRGVILKKFLEKYSPAIAIILSAIVFGIAHMNPWQFIAAFAIGLVIGWIYWKTQSIWPGIFMHFANNSFSFYLAKKYESININFHDIIGNTVYYISLLVLCLFVIYAIYLILYNYFRNLETKHNEKFSV